MYPTTAVRAVPATRATRKISKLRALNTGNGLESHPRPVSLPYWEWRKTHFSQSALENSCPNSVRKLLPTRLNLRAQTKRLVSGFIGTCRVWLVLVAMRITLSIEGL